jgi:hypothetical protein
MSALNKLGKFHNAQRRPKIEDGRRFAVKRDTEKTYEFFQKARPHCKLWRAIARRHGQRANYYSRSKA